MTEPLPPPSATGVRTAGDRFQWLVAWLGCIEALLDSVNGVENPIVGVGVEVDGAGNLDDVVLYRRRPPHTYMQVKYTVDSSTPVNLDYLGAPSSSGGPSILAKVAGTWRRLAASGEPVEAAIVSNRQLDPNDALISGRDSRTRLLLPRATGPGRRIAQARQEWAAAAALNEQELLGLLAVLEFDLGRDVGHMSDEARYAMAAAGLRGSESALNAGIDWVARQVVAGRRRLDLAAIQDVITTEALRIEDTRTIVSIATLRPDPLAAHAARAIDWVDRFEGDDPSLKRHPKAPATWAELQRDIDAIPSHLGAGCRVTVTGSIRLAPAFAVGAALRMVTGFDVATVQRGVLWRSDEPSGPPISPTVVEHAVGQGDDLAIAVEIATPMSDDVLACIRSQGLPVAHLVVLQPSNGPRNNAVDGPATACSWAEGIRDAVRRAVRGHPKVHLFLATPMGLALLLGHRWNRVAPTVVYEDLAQLGYEAAFTAVA
jgi:hypothetical protein